MHKILALKVKLQCIVQDTEVTRCGKMKLLYIAGYHCAVGEGVCHVWVASFTKGLLPGEWSRKSYIWGKDFLIS